MKANVGATGGGRGGGFVRKRRRQLPEPAPTISLSLIGTGGAMPGAQPMRLNERAGRVADAIRAGAGDLRAAVHSVAGGCVLDLGVKAAGGLAAGLSLARVCLADLGDV